MSILTLLLRNGHYISEVQVDAFLREAATATARVTRNPVENGADVNDHIIIEPMRFVMEGVVSNTGSSVLTAAAFATAQFSLKVSRSQAVWADLLELQASRTPFTLVQNLKSYNNVAIESLTAVQDVNTANALIFTANLIEIIYVGKEAPPIVEYSSSTTSDKASPTSNSGTRQLS